MFVQFSKARGELLYITHYRLAYQQQGGNSNGVVFFFVIHNVCTLQGTRMTSAAVCQHKKRYRQTDSRTREKWWKIEHWVILNVQWVIQSSVKQTSTIFILHYYKTSKQLGRCRTESSHSNWPGVSHNVDMYVQYIGGLYRYGLFLPAAFTKSQILNAHRA